MFLSLCCIRKIKTLIHDTISHVPAAQGLREFVRFFWSLDVQVRGIDEPFVHRSCLIIVSN